MTLSEITAKTRTILKWGAISAATLIAIFIIFKVATFVKELFFPTPPPPPQVSFGKLSNLEFPQSEVSKKLTYSIDTLTGTLPQLPTQAKVYRIKQNEPDLLALSKAQQKAQSVDFKDSPIALSQSVYQWKNKETSKTLTMNIFENNFNLFSSFLLKPVPSLGFTDTKVAVEKARSFLLKMDLYPSDIDETKTKANLFSIQNLLLVPATSISNAQVVQVSFFQKDVGNIPIYYPKIISPMNFLVSQINSEPQVVEANFSHQEIIGVSSTYPIKNANTVFEELKNGKGYIVSFQGQNLQVKIKKVSLGFYISEQRQEFLYPIIVFEGNDGFLAYIQGVTDEWVNR